MNFMSTLKKNLTAFIAATLGLFHFILLAIPYCGQYVKLGAQSVRDHISGYGAMGEDMTMLDAGGFAVFTQIITLLAAISLLLVGAYLVVRAFLKGKADLPGGFGAFSFEFLCRILLLAYAGASFLTFLACIIVSIANTGSGATFSSYLTYRYGVSIGFGPILGVLLSAGGVVAPLLLKKLGVLKETAPAEAAPVNAAPVNAAPAAPVYEAPAAPIYTAPAAPEKAKFCSNCGTPLEDGALFCSGCGTKLAPPVYACSQCGAPSAEGIAFCSQCGGKIVQK